MPATVGRLPQTQTKTMSAPVAPMQARSAIPITTARGMKRCPNPSGLDRQPASVSRWRSLRQARSRQMLPRTRTGTEACSEGRWSCRTKARSSSAERWSPRNSPAPRPALTCASRCMSTIAFQRTRSMSGRSCSCTAAVLPAPPTRRRPTAAKAGTPTSCARASRSTSWTSPDAGAPGSIPSPSTVARRRRTSRSCRRSAASRRNSPGRSSASGRRIRHPTRTPSSRSQRHVS